MVKGELQFHCRFLSNGRYSIHESDKPTVCDTSSIRIGNILNGTKVLSFASHLKATMSFQTFFLLIPVKGLQPHRLFILFKLT